MALQVAKNDPVGVRLSKHERAMLVEVCEALGFQSASEAVRYMVRHEFSALQTALATELHTDRQVAL